MEDNKDNTNPFSFKKFYSENPDAVLAGLGALKGIMDRPKEQAAVDNEIARTQYGYLLGAGVGNPSAVKRSSPFDNAVRGYMAGSMQLQQRDENKALLDAIKGSGKGGVPKVTSEGSVSLEEASGNPYHEPMISPEKMASNPFVPATPQEKSYVIADKGERPMDNIFESISSPFDEALFAKQAEEAGLIKRENNKKVAMNPFNAKYFMQQGR